MILDNYKAAKTAYGKLGFYLHSQGTPDSAQEIIKVAGNYLKLLQELNNYLNPCNTADKNGDEDGNSDGKNNPKTSCDNTYMPDNNIFTILGDEASSYDTLSGVVGDDDGHKHIRCTKDDKGNWDNYCLHQYNALIRASSFVSLVDYIAKKYSADIYQYIQSLSPTLPMDSLTHTVIFAVTYGGGIAPNWTLINLSTTNSPLAMIQGVRTHTLLLSIGPPTENTANIQNQTVANTSH